jgi:signal transduction histidine kinase
LENLLANAIEHGGPDVTIEIGPLSDASGFYVADDGPGIPPVRRERVFDHDYTTSSNGIGLGLTIVETVADAHGWRLTVAESDGGGARFELRTD